MTPLQIVLAFALLAIIGIASAIIFACWLNRGERWWQCGDCGVYFSNSGDCSNEPPSNQHIEPRLDMLCDGCLCDKLYRENHNGNVL